MRKILSLTNKTSPANVAPKRPTEMQSMSAAAMFEAAKPIRRFRQPSNGQVMNDWAWRPSKDAS